MGFFDSILSGAEHIAGFIARNTDNIGTAISAISRIAGVTVAEIVANNVAADEDNKLPILFNLLGKASVQLTNKMDAIMPINGDANSLVVPPSGPAGVTTTTIVDTAGLWKAPSLTDKGNVKQDLYSSVSNFMALNGIPTNIDNTRAGDLAQLVSQQLFDKAANLAALRSAAGDPVRTDFLVKALGEGITIKGTHLYYPIPLTGESQNQSWHSLIRMKYVQTQEAADWLAAAKKALAPPVRTVDTPVPPYNRTTIEVTWMAGPTTDTIMSNAEATVAKKAGYSIVDSGHTALTYTYNVYTTTDIGPGAVRQSFIDAIDGALDTILGAATAALSTPPPIPVVDIGATSCTLP